MPFNPNYKWDPYIQADLPFLPYAVVAALVEVEPEVGDGGDGDGHEAPGQLQALGAARDLEGGQKKRVWRVKSC